MLKLFTLATQKLGWILRSFTYKALLIPNRRVELICWFPFPTVVPYYPRTAFQGAWWEGEVEHWLNLDSKPLCLENLNAAVFSTRHLHWKVQEVIPLGCIRKTGETMRTLLLICWINCHWASSLPKLSPATAVPPGHDGIVVCYLRHGAWNCLFPLIFLYCVFLLCFVCGIAGRYLEL